MIAELGVSFTGTLLSCYFQICSQHWTPLGVVRSIVPLTAALALQTSATCQKPETPLKEGPTGFQIIRRYGTHVSYLLLYAGFYIAQNEKPNSNCRHEQVGPSC